MAPRVTAANRRRRLNSSPGNPPLPTLPFDLIVEILYSLPVKSLVQFKSVCKSWESLISSPKFAKKHRRVSTTCHNLLFRRLSKSEYFLNACPLSSLVTNKKGPLAATDTLRLEYPLNNRRHQILDKISGSCHGILCIQQLFPSLVILWNPSIRKFTKLPSLETPTTSSSIGYDHSTDSYKVVAFTTLLPSVEIYRTYVHTMGTDSWRRIQDFLYFPDTESGKFVSGTLNWLAYKDIHSAPSLILVSLDLETESYRELLLPDYGGVNVLYKSLWVLRDCLCLLSSHGAYSDVWLMKEYGNKDSWTKLFHVPYTYTRALYVYEDDQVLLEFRSRFVVYNSRDDTFKTLKIPKCSGLMIPEVYQESLISPCSED